MRRHFPCEHPGFREECATFTVWTSRPQVPSCTHAGTQWLLSRFRRDFSENRSQAAFVAFASCIKPQRCHLFDFELSFESVGVHLNQEPVRIRQKENKEDSEPRMYATLSGCSLSMRKASFGKVMKMKHLGDLETVSAKILQMQWQP